MDNKFEVRMDQEVKRGDLFWCNLPNMGNSVQSGHRIVMVLQNDKGNKFSPLTIVVPLTKLINKRGLPTHVILNKSEQNGLVYDSTIICENIITLDKRSLNNKVGNIESFKMKQVDRAVKISLGLEV